MLDSPHTLHRPWLPTLSPFPAHSAPWLHFCQGSHCTMTGKFHLFSPFCPHFCHVSRSCLCNPGFMLGKQTEGGSKARSQGGKGWITPNLFSEQDRAIPGTVPLRQSSASPEWKMMPSNLEHKTAFLWGYSTEGLWLDCLFALGFHLLQGCRLYSPAVWSTANH